MELENIPEFWEWLKNKKEQRVESEDAFNQLVVDLPEHYIPEIEDKNQDEIFESIYDKFEIENDIKSCVIYNF